MLQSFLSEIEDHRRPQGKRYQQEHILLFAILAILSGATSYRKIERFIVGHYGKLDILFQLGWKRTPAYTTIRNIIQGTSEEELEKCFRAYNEKLVSLEEYGESGRFIACDGKVLRGSFDKFEDQKAIQVFSAYLTDTKIIIAHEVIETKSNEIPAAQQMIEELGLSGYIYTFDAMHCQKKR